MYVRTHARARTGRKTLADTCLMIRSSRSTSLALVLKRHLVTFKLYKWPKVTSPSGVTWRVLRMNLLLYLLPVLSCCRRLLQRSHSLDVADPTAWPGCSGGRLEGLDKPGQKKKTQGEKKRKENVPHHPACHITASAFKCWLVYVGCNNLSMLLFNLRALVLVSKTWKHENLLCRPSPSPPFFFLPGS